MTHPVVHWEIGAQDLPKSRRFYEKLFGWTIDAGNPAYAMVDVGEGGLSGGIKQVQAQMPPYLTIYVEVDDLARYLGKAQELGGSQIVPPTPIEGVEGLEAFTMFQDPDRNVIGILKRAA